MKRNYKPHVALVALLILALIVSYVCNGCAVKTSAADKEEPMFRFEIESLPVKGYYYLQIITDTETGVQYLFYQTASGGSGLTRLEDE